MAKLGKNDLEKIMKSLSERRPVFHSEADFQHELAFELREHLKDAKVRLEYPQKSTKEEGKKRKYIDIVVFFDDEFVGIEVKYALKGKNKNKDIETINICEEPFDVSGQGAQTQRRKLFFTDIQKLEELIRIRNKDIECDYGYAIMLTNIKSIKEGKSSEFRLDKDAPKQGSRDYKKKHKEKHKQKVETIEFKLENEYGSFDWKGYVDDSRIKDKPEKDRKLLKEFNYLIVEIEKQKKLKKVSQ